MRGDCTIRIDGIGFTPEQVAATAAAKGLLSIELDLSSSEHCHCQACSQIPGNVLTFEEICGVIDQAKNLGAKQCILVDDAERSHAQLGELIEAIRQRDTEVELFTNGVGLDADMARLLRQQSVSVVVETGSSMRSPAIETLRAAGYFASGAPRLAARISISRGNLYAVPDWWREMRSNGIEPYVEIMTPRVSSTPPSDIERYGIRQLFETIHRIDRDEFGRAWQNPPELTGRSCKRHLFAVHVTPCGTIFACVGVTIPLGNIRSQSLRIILDESEVLENIRAFEQKVKEPCRSCCKTVDCYGCRGSAYQLTGDYLAGDQLCWKAKGVSIPALPAPIDTMIPHGQSIRLVDRIISVGERIARMEFTVWAGSPFVDANGLLDEAAYIEMIAQSFAASHGFHLSADERAMHRGMLLGVKDMIVHGTARTGERLLIDVQKVARFGDFGVVAGTVSREDGIILASAEIKVWRPSDEAGKAMIA